METPDEEYRRIEEENRLACKKRLEERNQEMIRRSIFLDGKKNKKIFISSKNPIMEYIVIRKARKEYYCHERDCGYPILKGVNYVEDHLAYNTCSHRGNQFIKYYINKICLCCWKGPLPQY